MFGTTTMQHIAHSRGLGTLDFLLTGRWYADLEARIEVYW